MSVFYVWCLSAASNMINFFCSVEDFCLDSIANIPTQLRFFLVSIQKTEIVTTRPTKPFAEFQVENYVSPVIITYI